jgi:predicted ATPase
MLEKLEITGFRGFASKQVLNFSKPNEAPGSGLTAIVGANNTGKSTAIEALRAFTQEQAPSFTQGRRNQMAGDQVILRLAGDRGKATVLKTHKPGGSEAEYVKEGGGIDRFKLLVLPARRVFSPYFHRSETSRRDYMVNSGFPAIRTSSMEQFTLRLFAIEKNRAPFDALLGRVLNPVPDWSIDQMDHGQYILKVKKGSAAHSSEGLGEGFVSLFYIIDALYDSNPGDFIAIDEPELSLHPALQRKLSEVLIEYSATRQIVLSTHSPYFVGLSALSNGSTIARVDIAREGSRISQISDETAKAIVRLMNNLNNPHIYDLLAREIFFAEDGVILVEGQEDVVFFKRIEQTIGPLGGTFFGWGVGGAGNMEHVATMLKELGFNKVVGILDGNRVSLVTELSQKFPTFHFFAIPATDVRTKAAIPEKSVVKGLLDDENETIRPEYLDRTRALFAEANRYLCG